MLTLNKNLWTLENPWKHWKQFKTSPSWNTGISNMLALWTNKVLYFQKKVIMDLTILKVRHKSITSPLQVSYKSLTRFLQVSYKSLTSLLQVSVSVNFKVHIRKICLKICIFFHFFLWFSNKKWQNLWFVVDLFAFLAPQWQKYIFLAFSTYVNLFVPGYCSAHGIFARKMQNPNIESKKRVSCICS